MIPDSPQNPNPWAFWFKRIHSEHALQRLERENRLDAKPITWAAAKYVPCLTTAEHGVADSFCRRTFTTWLVYVIAVMYIAMVLGTSGYNYFALFLKSVKRSDGSPRWTKEQVNLIPIGGSAINVVFGVYCIHVGYCCLVLTL